eukprot:1159061-Pelagomonas_calceolata.AAC.2
MMGCDGTKAQSPYVMGLDCAKAQAEAHRNVSGHSRGPTHIHGVCYAPSDRCFLCGPSLPRPALHLHLHIFNNQLRVTFHLSGPPSHLFSHAQNGAAAGSSNSAGEQLSSLGQAGLQQAQTDFPELQLTPASQPLTAAALAAMEAGLGPATGYGDTHGVENALRQGSKGGEIGAGKNSRKKGGLSQQQGGSLPSSAATQQHGQQYGQQQVQQAMQNGESVFALAAGDYQTLCLCSVSRWECVRACVRVCL